MGVAFSAGDRQRSLDTGWDRLKATEGQVTAVCGASAPVITVDEEAKLQQIARVCSLVLVVCGKSRQPRHLGDAIADAGGVEADRLDKASNETAPP